ncbi:hypothetical protein M2281_002194 [Mesorhizobium soli]|uniref:DUF995 domain-containing protein n=1 Tax=Pseudaminobacter soli (ex Li et al. 2025) TaxID=1295366 RepID=UPI002475077D|nr:DUF995 domain-containing protein [Mesorhizobium soli]MDH6231596.1 hypothetical protein [Mesorhizobium soli]
MAKEFHHLLSVFGGGRIWSRLVGASALFSVVSTPVIAEGTVILPPDAQALTSVELYMIYRDKSWLWSDGAGRMNDEGRSFSAWSDGKDGVTWADGRWIVTDTGFLCLKAIWHSATGAFPNKTCFSHRVYNGTIYQRKEPNGSWYVFRSSTSDKDGEFAKLTKEDVVSQPQSDIKASLSRK